MGWGEISASEPVVDALENARRDILECLRQLRLAVDSDTNPRARAMAMTAAINAGTEVTWCLQKLGRLTETLSETVTAEMQAEERG